MRVKAAFPLVIASMLCVAALFVCVGCIGRNAPEYHIDYNGEEDCYADAPETFHVGAKVRLYYEVIGTDTDYAFYLDDERISPRYDERKGYIIEFTMPDHDVSLRVERHSSMYMIENEG